MIRKVVARIYACIMKNTLRIRITVTVIILGTVIFTSLLLTYSKTGETYKYQIGEIAKNNIRVPWDIVYVKESESQLEKKRARDSEPLLFDMNRYILQDYIQSIYTFFREIDHLYETGEISDHGDISVLTEVLNEYVPDYMHYDMKTLHSIITSNNRDSIKNVIIRILNDVYSPGILEVAYVNTLQIPNTNVSVRTINDNGEYVEERRTLESIETLDSISRKLPSICNNYTSEFPEKLQKSIYNVVSSMIVQNMQFNSDETLKRINDAAESVEPVMGTLKKDQVIVREGDSITTESLNLISVINSETNTVNVNYTIGVLLFQLIFFTIILYFIKDNYKRIFPNMKSFIITFFLIIVFFTYTYFVFKAVDYTENRTLFPFFLPFPAILVILTILFNIRLSLLASLYMTMFVLIISTGDYSIMAIALASAFISIYGTRSLDKRINFLISGFALGAAHTIIIASIVLMKKMTSDQFITNFEIAMLSGVGNMIAAMGIFPLFENFFNLTTRFKLLELADLNAPIFKELLFKAPGTYNHSIMVANMAEAACKEIHADALLARVGSYYHDIGKLKSPAIFIENKKEDYTVNLSPEEYSKRIIDHVEYGVSLAIENNLPESIINFVREHHGKSIMSYFYHQALDVAHKSKRGKSVHPSKFAYPGPNPATKETAVVMLADSLEAAARTIKDPTHEKISSLVKKIIHTKMGDGALRNTPLTLKELITIENSFVNVLTGIYHTRIEYPDKVDIENLEKKVQSSNKSSSRLKTAGKKPKNSGRIKTNRPTRLKNSG